MDGGHELYRTQPEVRRTSTLGIQGRRVAPPRNSQRAGTHGGAKDGPFLQLENREGRNHGVPPGELPGSEAQDRWTEPGGAGRRSGLSMDIRTNGRADLLPAGPAPFPRRHWITLARSIRAGSGWSLGGEGRHPAPEGRRSHSLAAGP